MLQSIGDGKVANLLLYGLRGVGKTVLLKRFAESCRNKNFLPALRSQYSQKDSDPDEFTAGIKHVLRSAVGASSPLESTKGKIRLVGKYLKPASVGVPGLVYYEPSYTHGRQEPLVDHLAEYLIKNWQIIKDLGYKGTVFFLDEFHTLNDVKKNNWYVVADFLGAVNEAQKAGCGYSLVLSGLPILRKNIKTSRSYTERMFSLLEVSNLEPHDAKAALVRPLAGIGRHFSPRLVDAVINDTEGYPYFIQFFACEILQQIGKQKIGIKEYRSIRGGVIDRLYADFFDQRIADISAKEKNTLYHMSCMAEADMQFSLISNGIGGSKGAVSSHLHRLERKGLVYRHNHGLYKFALPMLRPYLLARHAPQSTSEKRR